MPRLADITIPDITDGDTTIKGCTFNVLGMDSNRVAQFNADSGSTPEADRKITFSSRTTKRSGSSGGNRKATIGFSIPFAVSDTTTTPPQVKVVDTVRAKVEVTLPCDVSDEYASILVDQLAFILSDKDSCVATALKTQTGLY